ncbi:MAG: hypothetical protein AAGH72_02685 [Verrucomicrobiota bacterium]
MTPHQVKEGYLSLPAKAKREFVLWAVQREFSTDAAEDLEPGQAESIQAALAEGQSSGSVSTAASPGMPAALTVVLGLIGLMLLLGAGAFLFKESQQSVRQADARDAIAVQQARQAAQAKFEAEEAVRPRSPTNLEYLNERIGKEVTLRGVPVKSEVGYLYFHEDSTLGARVKLISGGVVVYQSTELKEWVADQQELEIRGILIRNEEENLLEIPIDRQIQVKLVEP